MKCDKCGRGIDASPDEAAGRLLREARTAVGRRLTVDECGTMLFGYSLCDGDGVMGTNAIIILDRTHPSRALLIEALEKCEAEIEKKREGV